MSKVTAFKLLTFITILLSYLSVTVYKYSSLMDAILALLILGISFIYVFKKDIKIKVSNFLLIYISIFLVVLTQRTNLISLSLISAIVIVAEKTQEINVNDYIKISISCFVIVLLLYFIFGFNSNMDGQIWRVANQATLKRSALGFQHANQAMFKWFSIALALLTLCNKRNVYKITMIVCIISYIIYKFTISRTSMITIIITSILLLLFRKRLSKTVNTNLRHIIALLPLIYTLISYASISLSDFTYINDLFSGRFALYEHYISLSGLNLLGSSFIENNAMLDNSYLHLFLSKGIVFALVYIMFIYFLIKKNQKLTYCESIIIIGYFTAGLAETVLFKFELIILLIIINYISGEKESKEKNYVKQ